MLHFNTVLQNNLVLVNRKWYYHKCIFMREHMSCRRLCRFRLVQRGGFQRMAGTVKLLHLFDIGENKGG
jgi:hypothetical protein